MSSESVLSVSGENTSKLIRSGLHYVKGIQVFETTQWRSIPPVNTLLGIETTLVLNC